MRFRILCVIPLGIGAILAGCGGSSSSSGESANSGTTSAGGNSVVVGDFEVFDAGDGNSVLPAVNQSAERLFSISATANKTGNVAGNISDHTVAADYELLARLTAVSNDDNQLALYPSLNEFTGQINAMPAAIPGAWFRSYSDNGVIVGGSNSDTTGLFSLETQHVFTVPALVLAVPATRLGEGATWSTESPISTEAGASLGVLRTTGIVTALTTTALTVRVETVYVAQNQDDGAMMESIVEATYDTNTLLIRNGNVTSTIAFIDQVKRNGEPVTISSTHHIVHEIDEASP